MGTFKKIISLLTQSEKNKALMLLILIMIMAFVDMMGIASIFPFISVISNPQLIETNQYLNYFFKISKNYGVTSTNEFILLLGIIFLLFLIISLILKALTLFLQVRFVLMREYSIGKRLIEGYLHQPYTWFIDQYSSKLGKNILSEVSQVVGGIIMPFITIITQGAVILALLILILIIDTKLAIYSTLTLSLIYGTIYFLIKNYLYRKGAERLKANEVRFSAVSEAFNAIKEIKIFGIENYFINKFDKSAKLYANNLSLIKIIGQLPRYAIEGIAFGALIFLVFILMEKDKVFSDIAPIIVLYAFAGYRLMPALQQIYSSFSQLRFSHSTLDILYNDLNLIKNLNVPENNKTINLKKNDIA